jgi:hypothetical protein
MQQADGQKEKAGQEISDSKQTNVYIKGRAGDAACIRPTDALQIWVSSVSNIRLYIEDT